MERICARGGRPRCGQGRNRELNHGGYLRVGTAVDGDALGHSRAVHGAAGLGSACRRVRPTVRVHADRCGSRSRRVDGGRCSRPGSAGAGPAASSAGQPQRTGGPWRARGGPRRRHRGAQGVPVPSCGQGPGGAVGGRWRGSGYEVLVAATDLLDLSLLGPEVEEEHGVTQSTAATRAGGYEGVQCASDLGARYAGCGRGREPWPRDSVVCTGRGVPGGGR